MTAGRRILLVNPHWSTLRRQRQGQFRRAWPPLDLAIAGQLLENNGFTVRIVDNNVEHRDPEELGRLAREHDLTFVTSSPYDRWQCPALDITFFYETIQHMPRERLIVMGAHISERPQASLAATGASAAIVHEPEGTMLDVCRNGLYDGQAGVARMRDGELVRGPEPTPFDLEAAPFPAYHLLPMSGYYYELMGDRFALLEASRGCPYRCSFCYLGMYGPKFRQKSVDRFVDEIEWAVERQQCRNLYFMDLEFAINRRFVLAVCDAIVERGIQVSWCCQTRVKDVDAEVLAAMKRAGCRLIHFGVESGSDRILKSTGKNITTADAERAVRLTREHGIASAVFMNVGFPGETADEMRETRSFAIRLDPTFASFHIVMPFPGTPLASGMELPPLAAHQYPASTAASEQEFRDLKWQMRLCYAAFYLRPRYLARLWRDVGTSLAWRQARVLADLVWN